MESVAEKVLDKKVVAKKATTAKKKVELVLDPCGDCKIKYGSKSCRTCIIYKGVK